MKKIVRFAEILFTAALLAVLFAVFAWAQTPTFETVSDAADYMRAQMVRRSETVEYVLNVPADAMGDLTDTPLQTALNDWFGRFTDELHAALFRHTGDGREGDYLLAHYNRYSLVPLNLSLNPSTREFSLPLVWHIKYSSTAAQEAQVDAAVAAALSAMKTEGKTDYEKIRAINDYICGNVTYDYAHLDDEDYDLKYTAYAAIINKTAVCEGYASLFYRMALDAGLDARIITGMANDGLHAWNIVRVGDRWYQLDTTWDASLGGDRFFLRGSANFPDHTADEKFRNAGFAAAYPISSTDFEPPASDCAHVWGAETVTRAPGCETPGVLTWTCARCGDAKTEEIPAAGHRLSETEPIPATCTTRGRIPYFVCEVCGALFADADAVYTITAEETFRPALGHDFTAWVRLDAHSHRRVCQNDPAHTETESHSWTAGNKTPDGKMTETCAVCGAKRERPTEEPTSSSGVVIVIPVPSQKPTETTKTPEEPTTKPSAETTKAPEELTTGPSAEMTKTPEELTTKPSAETTKAQETESARPSEETTRTPGAFMLGDLNENGEVEVADARYVLRAAVGLENYPRGGRKFLAADVDGNGEIEVRDARLVLRAAVGLEDLKKKY